MEIWKDINNYEGIYQVSNKGRVKRSSGVFKGANQFGPWERFREEYIFKPSNDSRGYPQVILSTGVKRTARVHRLVAEMFLEPPSKDLVEECLKAGVDYVPVNHKDNNPENNCVENLEWFSPSYNLQYAHEQNRKERSYGMDNVNNVLSEEDVLEIYSLASAKTMSQESIADLYNIKQITVSNIKTGRSWSWLTKHPVKPKRWRRGKSRIMSEAVQQDSANACEKQQA